MAAALGWSLVALVLVPPLPVAAQEEAESPRGESAEILALAVAQFRGDTAGNRTGSAVSSLLAARLEAESLRVVPPETFGAPPGREDGARELRRRARERSVDAVVSGRVQRFGERVSIQVRLHSAATGESLATFVEEAQNAAEIDGAVDQLGQRIAAGLPDALAAAEDAPSSDPAETERAGEGAPSNSDEQVSIQSEELEIFPGDGGGRRVLFTGKVRVSRGSIKLDSDRLEALYPPGGQNPERLVATGRVRIRAAAEDGGEARRLFCDRATYVQKEESLLCVGRSVLHSGTCQVHGDEIEILFAADVIRARRNAHVDCTEGGQLQ